MRIFLVSAYFPPEVGSASHLFYELGSEFVRRGHSVTVLTGYPTYNIDSAKLETKYRAGLWMKESVNGMEIIRIRSFGLPRRVPVLRGIDQFTQAFTSLFAGVFLTQGNVDIVLVYSPPLFLGFTALALRLFRNARVVLNVQDLFPQSAIDLGLLKNSFLIQTFRAVERFLYDSVDLVTAHSEGNKKHIVGTSRSASVQVVPNVVDTKEIVPGKKNNSFRARYGISEKEFIISFAGVIGYSQDLDTVIGAARILANQPGLVFYIVGDGLEKQRLMDLARGMSNVRFLPMLPKEEYADLLRASDVCLVTLRKEVRTPVVPSKILSIMAAGRPLVASLPLQGDAPVLIQEADCGVCVEPEKPEQMAEALSSLREDKQRLARYASNGRKYVERHCSLDVCAESYEHLFKNLLEH